jgi:hypothetical protein
MSKAIILFITFQLLFLPHLQKSSVKSGKVQTAPVHEVPIVKPLAPNWPLFRWQLIMGPELSRTLPKNADGC